ncbi:MAG TPA: hypothetical protein VF440_08640 [Novosphingobium sp.]
MDATPIDLSSARAHGTSPDGVAYGIIGARWAALHEAAGVAASLAGIAVEPFSPTLRAFPDAIRQAGATRRALAEQAIEDICAILEPGLAALLAIHARSGEIRAPALALWQEFRAARDAALALASSPGSLVPGSFTNA